MALKRKILILGGSSDIGVEVINIFMKKNWSITAHYNSNLNALRRFKGKIKLIKLPTLPENCNFFVNIFVVSQIIHKLKNEK